MVAVCAEPAVDPSTENSGESLSRRIRPRSRTRSSIRSRSRSRTRSSIRSRSSRRSDPVEDNADQDSKCANNQKIFRELLGNSCWIVKGDENGETEIFESDEEDEDSEFQANKDCAAVEEKHDLDGLLSKYQKMAFDKSVLEEDQKWLISERMHQEREILEARECIKEVKEQQVRERDAMERALEDAKASNKVLREKFEGLQENQERLGRENAMLKAEVDRLTETLESLSKDDNPVKIVGASQSSPWRPWRHPLVWECPTCTFQNPAANLRCDMCR